MFKTEYDAKVCKNILPHRTVLQKNAIFADEHNIIILNNYGKRFERNKNREELMGCICR